MSKKIIPVCAAITVFAMPAFADDAQSPPTDPYYAPAMQACSDVDLTIYFEPGKAELTAYSRDAIRETREQLAGCAVTAINGTAVANDAAGEANNLTLAEARRTTVVKALADHGIRSTRTDLKTEVSVAPENAIMSRNVGLTLETVTAQVG